MIQPHKEKYWAVRIGKRPQNTPYFMVREGTSFPELFHSRIHATETALKLISHSNWVVVKVSVSSP